MYMYTWLLQTLRNCPYGCPCTLLLSFLLDLMTSYIIFLSYSIFVNYENVTVEDRNDRVYEPMQNYYASLSKKTMQTGTLPLNVKLALYTAPQFPQQLFQQSVVIFQFLS